MTTYGVVYIQPDGSVRRQTGALSDRDDDPHPSEPFIWYSVGLYRLVL